MQTQITRADLFHQPDVLPLASTDAPRYAIDPDQYAIDVNLYLKLTDFDVTEIRTFVLPPGAKATDGRFMTGVLKSDQFHLAVGFNRFLKSSIPRPQAPWEESEAKLREDGPRQEPVSLQVDRVYFPHFYDLYFYLDPWALPAHCWHNLGERRNFYRWHLCEKGHRYNPITTLPASEPASRHPHAIEHRNCDCIQALAVDWTSLCGTHMLFFSRGKRRCEVFESDIYIPVDAPSQTPTSMDWTIEHLVLRNSVFEYKSVFVGCKGEALATRNPDLKNSKGVFLFELIHDGSGPPMILKDVLSGEEGNNWYRFVGEQSYAFSTNDKITELIMDFSTQPTKILGISERFLYYFHSMFRSSKTKFELESIPKPIIAKYGGVRWVLPLDLGNGVFHRAQTRNYCRRDTCGGTYEQHICNRCRGQESSTDPNAKSVFVQK